MEESPTSHNPKAPHTTKNRKTLNHLPVGQRHATKMSGSWSIKLDGDILPFYFKFIPSNNTKRLKDNIQVNFD